MSGDQRLGIAVHGGTLATVGGRGQAGRGARFRVGLDHRVLRPVGHRFAGRHGRRRPRRSRWPAVSPTRSGVARWCWPPRPATSTSCPAAGCCSVWAPAPPACSRTGTARTGARRRRGWRSWCRCCAGSGQWTRPGCSTRAASTGWPCGPTVEVTPRPPIPVYLAGFNPRMVAAAGAVADGLVGHPIFTRRYVEEVVRPALAAGAARTGRNPDVPIAGYVICSVGDDADRARRDAAAQIAFYVVARTYAGAGRAGGVHRGGRPDPGGLAAPGPGGDDRRRVPGRCWPGWPWPALRTRPGTSWPGSAGCTTGSAATCPASACPPPRSATG